MGTEFEAFIPALDRNIRLKVYYLKDLAHVESDPHIVHNGNVHDGGACAYQFACFGEYFGNLSGSLRYQAGFPDV